MSQKPTNADDSDMGGSSSTCLPSEELLSNLMAALAAGARAVQGLPVEDEFEYQSSFPEFQNLVQQNQEDLLDAILLAVSSGDESLAIDTEFQGLTDPLLWEACSDICEWLTEQAEASGASQKVKDELQTATGKARSSFGQLMKGIVKMDKPQDVHEIYGDDPSRYLNSRVEPFVPPIAEKFHATQPLDLTLKPGHGIEDRFGAWRPPKKLADNIVAASQHVPHPYQTELENLQFSDWQLAAPETKPPKIPVATGPLEATWVDTPEALDELTKRLESAKEISMDLEAHNYRSFAGITCLIQITMGPTESEPQPRNYLIDPFPLWQKLGAALGPVLANPKIVKVMHGAESDVQWLQRDFGLYIVNLFDTYNAADLLKLKRLSYAHLLQEYVGIIPDKSHQLADWRQRPLPPAMKEYAIMDTHYLLDIYRHLKYDLEKHKDASVKEAFDRSRKVCLIRYAPDAFKPDGYRSLMSKRRSKSELNETQEQVLKELYDWRDQVARQYDESLIFVCDNSKLLRLALACPTNFTALQGLLQPVPPIVIRHAKQILGLVQRCVKPPFFKPATTDPDDTPGVPEKPTQPRTLMSPVLGTEALYRQAGWISPNLHGKASDDPDNIPDGVTTTTDEDDTEDGDAPSMKPRRVLAVHEANQKYRTSQFTPHSLQLGPKDDGQDGGMVVDGTGSARAVHPTDMDVEEEAHLAQTNAAHIRTAQEKHAVLGLISAAGDLEDGDADDEGGEEEDEGADKSNNEEHFVIPRSMREIYRISNHNRRNKKSSSPLRQEPNEKEAQELAKAEAVLKARALEGKNYFDEIPGSPKRQRTKSTGTASVSSDDVGATGHDSGFSREDDIAMMEEIGWIKGKEEVESMMKQRDSAGEGEDDGEGAGASSEDDGMKQQKTFDYSTVGSIGAFCASASANPFFAGAATAGGHLNQQFGKQDTKKKPNTGRGKQSRRPQQQTERPERNQGRSQAYKKR